jgi:hypothetical protein
MMDDCEYLDLDEIELAPVEHTAERLALLTPEEMHDLLKPAATDGRAGGREATVVGGKPAGEGDRHAYSFQGLDRPHCPPQDLVADRPEGQRRRMSVHGIAYARRPPGALAQCMTREEDRLELLFGHTAVQRSQETVDRTQPHFCAGALLTTTL